MRPIHSNAVAVLPLLLASACAVGIDADDTEELSLAQMPQDPSPGTGIGGGSNTSEDGGSTTSGDGGSTASQSGGRDPGAGGSGQCNPGEILSCGTWCGSQGTLECSITGTWGTCTPPATETDCHNNVDDDCDGVFDGLDFDCPPDTETCEDQEGGNCNDDPGYGDRCAPEDNTGNCSPERFWAWCNRRNPDYPDIWDSWLYDWVDIRCDGVVEFEDPDSNGTYVCHSSANIIFRCTTPLVLAFDAATHVVFVPGEHGFDLMPGAGPTVSDWPTAATPWLGLDRNGNGRIDDGSELFGSATPLARGGLAQHGFEALAELDDNGDGVVDAGDASWPRLLVWSDVDGDGVSEPEEIRPAPELGLVRLDLAFHSQPLCDRRGNCERERAGFAWRDTAGEVHTGAVVDVHLRLGRR